MVTEADRPRAFAWVVLDDSGDPARPSSSWRYRIDPLPGGGSRVRQRFTHGPGASYLRAAAAKALECPAPVRTLSCAAIRRSPALTDLRVDGSWISPSSGTSSDAPRRGAGPVPGNLARSESASGTQWRGIRRLTALPGWERGRLAT